MKPAEAELINAIQELQKSSLDKTFQEDQWIIEERIIKKLEQLLMEQESFGNLTTKFINNEALINFILNETQYGKNYFLLLWLRIEDYLNIKDNSALAQEKLKNVEEVLKLCMKDITEETKARGIAMLPKELANPSFIRALYSTNDEHLHQLFLTYLPAPRAEVFAGRTLPKILIEREQSATKTIKDLLKRNKNDPDFVEKIVTKGQRLFRAKQRAKENLKRLPYRYKELLPDLTEEETQAILHDANTPYKPKCDEKLAQRINHAAKKVKLFSTVKHCTAASALENIFNNGLRGRRSMLRLYMFFRRAALLGDDIRDGDADAVCLGSDEIDPKAQHGIELVFDAKKIAKNNQCVFYKQKDLGYELKRRRSVKLGTLDLSFSHTELYKGQRLETSSLILYSHGNQCAWSNVINALLIADNVNDMHQILTLNFFRLVDELKDCHLQGSHYKDKIYSALSELNDEELVQALQNIGKNMTDTMEFNFYGAHKIDFSTLLMIKNAFYSLNLASFVEDLKAGHIEELNQAKKELPEIFNSYRFIDYLLSVTSNKNVVAALQEQRKACTLPAWMVDEPQMDESKIEFKK